MAQSNTYKTYAHSLSWLALSAAIAAGSINIFQITIIDFMHVNSNRSISNAVSMIFILTPVFGILAAISVFIVFSPSQIAQAIAEKYTKGLRYQLLIMVGGIPISSVLTWYCWDILLHLTLI